MTRRLIAGYLALALVVLVALEIPLGVVYARQERQSFNLRIERDAGTLASLAEDALEAGGPYADLRDVVERYESDSGARVVVVDRSGVSVVDTDTSRPLGRSFTSRPEVAAALRGDRAVGERGSQTLGDRIVYVAVPSASGGVVHGAVRVSVPADRVDARVRRYWLVLLGIGVVVMAAVAAVGWVLARSVSSPLAQLGAVAERVGDGDLSARAPEDAGPPEVRALARRLNDSTVRLEALLAAQRDFVADASHQLRTPLTAMRLRLENLERDVTPAGRADLDAAAEETERLNDLVEGLLALARAERPAEGTVPVDVGAVCRDRVAAWQPLAEEEGRRITVEVADGVVATLAPGALEQILDNLIDNAVRATPADTTVAVSAAARGDRVTVSVADRGPGMSEGERRAAFERFWTTRPGSGSGLGLAVVARLATAAGGQARLLERDGGGLVAEVTLPCTRARGGG